MIRRSATFVAFMSALGCTEFVPTIRQVEPGILAVETAPGVTLELLDWGGAGPTLVFLGGAGHTAHEFDEFAPRLTDTFHVIGITRRGVGASSASRHRVDRDRITDIARVLDALMLKSVVLVGHSQGGLEAAHFAREYPDRCMGIVHLDSAYLGGPPGALEEIFRLTPPPEAPLPMRADSASAQAMRAWIERTQGFLLPASEIRARNTIDETGRILGPAPRNTSPRFEWFGSLPTLEWSSVTCPAVGLYAVPAPLETWIPHYAARYDSLHGDERERAEAYVRAFSAWTAERREEFGRLPQNEVVELYATGHYFFLEHPEQELTLAAIRGFVAGLD